MEKQLSNLSILTAYQNRQVILNYYQDDLLYKRDGFHFLNIQLTDSALLLLKKDGTTEAINCNKYPVIYINTDFQNYYVLKNNEERLEIYFP